MIFLVPIYLSFMILSDTMTVSSIDSIKPGIYLFSEHLKTTKVTCTRKYFKIDFSVLLDTHTPDYQDNG